MKDDLVEVILRTGRDRRMGTDRNINYRKGSGIRISKTNDRGMRTGIGVRGERHCWRGSRRGRNNRFSRRSRVDSAGSAGGRVDRGFLRGFFSRFSFLSPIVDHPTS